MVQLKQLRTAPNDRRAESFQSQHTVGVLVKTCAENALCRMPIYRRSNSLPNTTNDTTLTSATIVSAMTSQLVVGMPTLTTVTAGARVSDAVLPLPLLRVQFFYIAQSYVRI